MTEHEQRKTLLIVDFGSQTAHLIGRRFRQMGISTEYADPDEAMNKIRKVQPRGLILSGGPSSVYEDHAPTIDPKVFDLGLPTLGICYGWQIMAHILGGRVQRQAPEYGPEQLDIAWPGLIFEGIGQFTQVYMSHGDSVVELPPNFSDVASTANTSHAAVVDPLQNLYGVQFHPEVAHTLEGAKILQNFAEKICGLATNLTYLNPQTLIEKIRETVGDQKVICGVSGGVDSTVTAFLIAKAIGKNLIPVYIDSGLMREGTDDQVKTIFSKLIQADLMIVDARTRFMKALKGLVDPEQKRKAIGRLYVDLFQEQALKRTATFLAQGTIYSDVIESKGSKNASQIKSHHNVGGLPSDLRLQMLEPLREYYKDEVREIGRLVGLPEKIVNQQPFPGPGYAVRIRGEVTHVRLDQVKKADQIVIDEMRNSGLWGQAFQCFALMTGAESTAVKGDARVFAEVVAIRAYKSDDVMTSDWLYLPRHVLQKMASRIVNEVPNVSRVVYDITTKPPATMEWE